MNTIMISRMIVTAGLAMCVATGASAQIDASYSEDFEGLDAMSASALGDAGWLVGANVFDSTGAMFLYDYFAFPAPNGSGAFSNVATGEGGMDQGAQQLVIFNDYNNADHGNGSGNRIEANFFREWTIGAADVGNWTFSFDAKRGDIGGASTAQGFIKVLDPAFNLLDIATIDTTAIDPTWQRYSISVDIDASQVGGIFQIGFLNVASNFEASGVVYDNLQLAYIPAPGSAGLLALAGLAASRRRR